MPDRTPPRKPDQPPPPAPELHDAREWDSVDEASWQSFPASDAPSRWAGRDRAPESAERSARDVQAGTGKRVYRRLERWTRERLRRVADAVISSR